MEATRPRAPAPPGTSRSAIMSRKDRNRVVEGERARREELERQELGLQEYAWEKPKAKRVRRPVPPKRWDLN